VEAGLETSVSGKHRTASKDSNQEGRAHISDKEMEHVFGGMLAFVADEARLEQLLSMLPASSPLGCMAPIAGALFHTSASVRGFAASILRSIEDHKAARPCVTGLNAFLLQGLAQQPPGTYAYA